MEKLLDAADALASDSERPARPDFSIPEEFRNEERTRSLLELKETSSKGKGWFARRDIPAGTIMMVAKPIALVMCWQDDGGDDEDESDDGDNDMEDNEEEEEDKLNLLLHLQLLEGIKKNPSLWLDELSCLFPRNDADMNSLPAKALCTDDAVKLQVETKLQELRNMKKLSAEEVTNISKRLPQVVRYNVLSVETCPELLSYPNPGGHSSLSAVGVYHHPSFFNHAARPNVSRWAIGDIMGFVSNQDIKEGTETCISYLEHDVLCESPHRRNFLLRMDFDDKQPNEDSGADDEEGPQCPVVDSEVQNELMEMELFERLDSIQELMQQACGKAQQEQEDGTPEIEAMEVEGGAGWFQCDIQNLRILKAITLDGMGQTQKALQLWEECVHFTETNLPPSDEASVVMRVQAALCAWHMGEVNRAKDHAQTALKTHNLLFGGGVTRFRRRYQRDLQLSLRPTKGNGPNAVDVLWPVQ